MPKKSRPDAATYYAERVQAGHFTANARVRQVTARHLDEYRSSGLPYWYDPDKAKQAIDFFKRLRIPMGEDQGKPFLPFPWQSFVIGCTFGWRTYHADDTAREIRRYREVLVQTGRGSGKSPLLAGFLLQGILDDDEPHPQIHLMAARSEQADITWKFLRLMVDFSEDTDLLTHHWRDGALRKRDEPVVLDFKGGKIIRGSKYLYVQEGDRDVGEAVLVSADSSGRGATGVNSSRIIYDEYHDFETDELLDRFRSGRKQRRQPLVVGMTNAGASDQTPYGREYQRVVRVLDGRLPDEPHLLALLYEPDEGDRPFEDSKTWEKMNPSNRYGYPGKASIRHEVAEARRSPDAYARVSRFQFCIWTKAVKPWLNPEVIDQAMVGALSPLSVRRQRECFVTVDLGVNRSLSAVCFLWDMEDHLEVGISCWGNIDYLLPKSEHLNIPFGEWFEDGLNECGGDVEVGEVAAWTAKEIAAHRVRGLAMDTFKKPSFLEALSESPEFRELGIRVQPGDEARPYSRRVLNVWNHPQGFTENKTIYDKKRGLWMTASLAAAEEELMAGRVRILETKPVRYGMEIASVERKDKLARIVKDNHDLPNDPAVVLVEAIGLYQFMRHNAKRASVMEATRAIYDRLYGAA